MTTHPWVRTVTALLEIELPSVLVSLVWDYLERPTFVQTILETCQTTPIISDYDPWLTLGLYYCDRCYERFTPRENMVIASRISSPLTHTNYFVCLQCYAIRPEKRIFGYEVFFPNEKFLKLLLEGHYLWFTDSSNPFYEVCGLDDCCEIERPVKKAVNVRLCTLCELRCVRVLCEAHAKGAILCLDCRSYRRENERTLRVKIKV